MRPIRLALARANRGSLLLPAAVLTALSLLLLPTEGDAKAGQGPIASFVKGDVEYGQKADGPMKRLKKKRKVPPGSFVKTGDDARLELKSPDGSVVRVGPASVVHISASGFDPKSKQVQAEANVVSGQVWANVSKLVGSEARFQVKTQNAVAGVRGTVFRVNIDRDKATVVKVYNGAVAVSNSPFFTNQDKDSAGVGPIRKDRKEIAAPFQEISKKEWEQRVEKMMQVRVSADGQMTKAAAFTLEEEKAADEAEAEWVNWNLSCDQGACDGF